MKSARLFFLLSIAPTLSAQLHPVCFSNPHVGARLSSGVPQADSTARPRAIDTYGKLPLSFEANRGQIDPQVRFLSRSAGYNLFLTPTEAVLTLHRVSSQKPGSTTRDLPSPKDETAVLWMKLVGANAKPQVSGQDELSGKSNYFIGNDPKKWHSNVPTYAKVKYAGIYPGIDLVYYGNQRQLEYDFIVSPGADPRRIMFDVQGAKRIRQDGQGELVFKMGEDEIRWHKPVVYQEKNGARELVAADYAIKDKNHLGFEVAAYDASLPLYIDPLIYSTYLGGTGYDWSNSIAVDTAGNVYVTGWTGSADFPTKNPLQPANAGGTNGYDAFVTKINPAGSALVYSTYLGGSADDESHGIAVDSAGNAYVTGTTYSADFPITPGAFQTVCNAGHLCYPYGDAFVAKLNPQGSALVYSTYLGGSFEDFGVAIAADSAGNAYVIGSAGSIDFPTKNPAQPIPGGNVDAFVAKLNPAGSDLVYSTYLGGSGEDWGGGIAVDSAGNAYVTGKTSSTDFPTKNPLQPAFGGFQDAFVAKLNVTGSAFVYSTYLGGGKYDWGSGIAVDSAGNAYVTGPAQSTDFPTTPGAFQITYNGGAYDAFVAKLNAAGSGLVYSTYLGGESSDGGEGIAVDTTGSAYVTGYTRSYSFPVVNSLQKRRAGADRAFVSRLNPAGSALVYSTFLGGSNGDGGLGIAVDSAGNAYVTGITSSIDFPTQNPLQPNGGGGLDAFVAKLNIAAATTTALTSSPNPSTYGQAVTFIAVVNSSLGAPPDGEIVTFVKGNTVLGTGSLSGGSATFATPTLKVGTNVVKAVYGGDTHFYGSTSNTVSQAVNKASTTTTLASSLNPSNFGQAVTFTASVAQQFGGNVTGTVTFYDGTTALKTLSLSGSAAKFTTSTLASGTHLITATYNGTTNFKSSSALLTQTVN